ncbi:MAG: hypothetical protein WC551_07325 [Patescibacteria group bacterium]
MEMILKISEVLPANVARLGEWIDDCDPIGWRYDESELKKELPLRCHRVHHPTEKNAHGQRIPRTVVSILSTKIYQNDAGKTRMVVEIKVLTHRREAGDALVEIPRIFVDRVLELLGIFPAFSES